MVSMHPRIRVTAPGVTSKVPFPKLAQNVLPGMGDRFKPGQAQKAAGPLDRMDQPEDILKDRSVLGILLELHQFDVENRKALGAFREEFV